MELSRRSQRTPWVQPTTLRNVYTILVLGFMLLNSVNAGNPTRYKLGFCNPRFPHLKRMFPVHSLQMPADHFHNESRYEPHLDKTFKNRFWFNDTYYKPGGPVIIQNAGEISGDFHLTDLQIGLHHELAKATNGLAVLLEHRYYGHSWPIFPHTTEDFRLLTVEQAMADQAYFAQNVVFPGLEHMNLTAPNTPWFAIGCSYPGALTAYERIQYPDLFWAALSSSGTTAPKANYWEYYDVVSQYAPQDCVTAVQKIINMADNILMGGNESQVKQLKKLFQRPFNLPNQDFANQELIFEYFWQVHNWLPCLNEGSNPTFCPDITAPTVLYPKAKCLESQAKEALANGGWGKETDTLIIPLLNFIGFIEVFHINRTEAAEPTDCATPSASSSSSAPVPSASAGPPTVPQYLSFQYQICVQLGGFLTADVPPGTLPLLSTYNTLEYTSRICRDDFNLTGIPDTASQLRYGGHNLSYPRLMLTGGEADPWRPMTPLASLDTPTRLNYSSTLDQPYFVIPGATHCWDWPGVFESQVKPGVPPDSIKEVHDMEIHAFQRWLKEWHDAHPNYNPYVLS